MNWIKYNKLKPKIGEFVLVYRDIESKQIYSTIWSEKDERFADWNEITHWMPLEYPSFETKEELKPEIIDLLISLLEYMDSRSDVEGDSEHLRPNEEMSFKTQIDELLEKIK